MTRRRASHHTGVVPLERLGRWTGEGWAPVERGSVGHGNVYVFSHGWAPGLRPEVDSSPGFLRVWDDGATTAKGARFDRWYAPLAEAISAADPSAIVLGYTWIDLSATKDSRFRSVRSQGNTTRAGHLLATALRHALADDTPPLHLIGHSHGAKVVTLAGVLRDQPPVHLTLFDSPENALPVIGGAFNDLSSYLRTLSIGSGPGKTFVDTYPSKYGIRYGAERGLGDVVDCMLDAENFSLDDSVNAHSYPWLWYIETARDLDKGVGFAWSPLISHSPPPRSSQLRQRKPRDGETDDPWRLERAPLIRTGGTGFAATIRPTRRSSVDTPPMQGPGVHRGLMWRARGTDTVYLPFEWLAGPSDATVTMKINGVERWRSVKGWADHASRRAAIPMGGMRSGPGWYEVRIESPAPAAIKFGAATMRSVRVPALSEYRSWIRPIAGAALIASAALLARRVITSTRKRA